MVLAIPGLGCGNCDSPCTFNLDEGSIDINHAGVGAGVNDRNSGTLRGCQINVGGSVGEGGEILRPYDGLRLEGIVDDG